MIDNNRQDRLIAEVETNPCQTIEELSNTLNQPRSTIQDHLRQIGKVNRAGVRVPQNLSGENKANRFVTCKLSLQRHHAEPVFDRFNTVDEKWVLYENPRWKTQWLSPKEVLGSRDHPKRVLLCVWWSIRGIVYFEFLKPGPTANSDVYYEQFDRVNLSLTEYYPVTVNTKGSGIMQDRPVQKGRWKKVMNCSGRYCLSHHAHPISQPRITIISIAITLSKWQKISKRG